MVKIKTSIQEPFERTYRTLVCIQKTHQIDQNVKNPKKQVRNDSRQTYQNLHHSTTKNFPKNVFMFILIYSKIRQSNKGLSIMYVRKIFRKTNISNPLIRTFLTLYVLNGWPLIGNHTSLRNTLSFCMKSKYRWQKCSR